MVAFRTRLLHLRFNIVTIPPKMADGEFPERTKRLRFSAAYDVTLLKEVVRLNPFKEPKRWTTVAREMGRLLGREFTYRAVKDRTMLLVKGYRSKDMVALRTGPDEEYVKRDALLQKIVDMTNKPKDAIILDGEYPTVTSDSENSMIHLSEEVQLEVTQDDTCTCEILEVDEDFLHPNDLKGENNPENSSDTINCGQQYKWNCSGKNESCLCFKEFAQQELAIKKKKVDMEVCKLQIEEKRLAIEEQRFQLEKEKFELDRKERETRLQVEVMERTKRLEMEDQCMKNRMKSDDHRDKMLDLLLQLVNKKV